MIVVTGAAGFIGSCLIKKLNDESFFDIVAVDDFSSPQKEPNLAGKTIKYKVHRKNFATWLAKNHRFVQFVYHIGARTDTTEMDSRVFNKLNLNYSKLVWKLCVKYGLPLVYASSAATYGGGEFGYDDNHRIINKLKPLNPYGVSKNDFDKWALKEKKAPYFWAGLKFFNVFGPNEYHKGRMASVVFHAYNQIKEKGEVKLFRSHKPEYKDGEQKRDFVYVKDVVDVCYYMLHHRTNSGIYNLGSGKARTFLDLINALFFALKKKSKIKFIDTPTDIRNKYQYFTEAGMDKLRSIGYDMPFQTLEQGVTDYVKNYLKKGKYY